MPSMTLESFRILAVFVLRNKGGFSNSQLSSEQP
jgi:hypothetical protein